MKLQASLPDGGKIFVSNSGAQTTIALESHGGGSSQSQSRSFTTGEWKRKPTLSQSSGALTLSVEGGEGTSVFKIQGSSIEEIEGAEGAGKSGEQIALEEAGDNDGPQPMAPMKPMKPLF